MTDVLTSAEGTDTRPLPRRRRSTHSKEMLWALAFIAPALLAIITMRIVPAIGAFWSSLHKAFPGGLKEPVFTGLENYIDLFSSAAFGDTVLRTLVFNLIINPAQVAIALMIAVLLTRRIRMKLLWRTLIFIPATIPIVGSSIVWGIGMRPDGPLNAILEAVGIGRQPFLTSPDQALASIMIVATWVGVGYWMLFLISGIEAIPDEYYEAAKLDRAGPIRTFFSITLPQLKRPLLFVLVADTVANFVLFVPVQMLTGGGPENSTTMLMFDAYRTSYTYSDKSLGSAEVVILTVIMLAFVALQFLLLREDREGAANA
ncbi:carbohydrate ABC transporter permease [Microbacterium sp. A82]|uniref:carbohydrate ABC transporter permease n=1 Tax=Microbacterium sp. A82 TaxID=3450452 RepID=UPI003F385615